MIMITMMRMRITIILIAFVIIDQLLYCLCMMLKSDIGSHSKTATARELLVHKAMSKATGVAPRNKTSVVLTIDIVRYM